MKSIVFSLMASALLACAGCSSGDLGIPGDGTDGNGNNGGNGGGGDGTGTNSTPPLCTTTGTAYAGFAGTVLGSDRVQAVIGADRGRIKPFSALGDEYMRVSNYTPPVLASNASTFAEPPANWYQEPTSSAITVYTTYRASFQSCLQVTQDATTYGAAPTNATATAQCTAWTRKFWSRDATPDEMNTCTGVALTDTASEPDMGRRWAYVCAAVLSSAGFVSY
ncbi:MAG TPA: hypothetical protein VF407_18590 [Polyangiaceae bacterium]